MCLNCGCDLPYEDWDSPENITVDTIKKATSTPKAKGKSASEVIDTIMKTWYSDKVKEEDKTFRTGKKQTALGDVIDKLMDWGASKAKAVAEAPKIKDILKKG